MTFVQISDICSSETEHWIRGLSRKSGTSGHLTITRYYLLAGIPDCSQKLSVASTNGEGMASTSFAKSGSVREMGIRGK